MGLSGLEPPTSRLSGVRSNQLSYKPICQENPARPVTKLKLRFRSFSLSVVTCLSLNSSCAFRLGLIKCSGDGDEEIRTLDPLLARQVLSQLSYIPFLIWRPPALPHRLQCSTIGRSGLNRRVRDGYGCFP